ncbi:MAG: hypothetical protein LQ352_000105 [Teloschistes flavicans]|nr:MAG: hypothetical protein LQ352_000105 [Teloschistes flavicans]
MAESLEVRPPSNATSRNNDQWQRKKQSKEEARAAKRAKLDPDNSKSAKDILDERAENARKRKRDEEGDGSEVEGLVPEDPIQGSKKQKKEAKKQKREYKDGKVNREGLGQSNDPEDETARDPAESHSKKSKDVRRAEKRQLKAERKKAKGERKKEQESLPKKSDEERHPPKPDSLYCQVANDAGDTSDSGDDDPRKAEIKPMDVSQLANESQKSTLSTASSSPDPDSAAFDQPAVLSGSSSVSSIVPPAKDDPLKADEHDKESAKPEVDHTELEARLRRRIEELRAGRNADGLNGKPARTRQELIEARRQKAEQSKAHRKELRRKEKEEAAHKQAETLARGSPLLSPASASLGALSPQRDSNNFSFGRVAFPDGQQASAQLNSIIDPRSKVRGPQDPLTALKAAQNKQSRMNGLDEGKRNDMAEKDMWLNARKRAHGDRVRDDTSLLKKALKRKEKQKRKSEKEWGDRLEGVKKAGEMKQRKREDNLAKRRDEKGGKGKKVKGGKKRPGFEGSFRTKAPRK